MRITKQQLKIIIKEELEQAMAGEKTTEALAITPEMLQKAQEFLAKPELLQKIQSKLEGNPKAMKAEQAIAADIKQQKEGLGEDLDPIDYAVGGAVLGTAGLMGVSGLAMVIAGPGAPITVAAMGAAIALGYVTSMGAIFGEGLEELYEMTPEERKEAAAEIWEFAKSPGRWGGS